MFFVEIVATPNVGNSMKEAREIIKRSAEFGKDLFKDCTNLKGIEDVKAYNDALWYAIKCIDIVEGNNE